MSYAVGRRRNEIGVRIALGADAGSFNGARGDCPAGCRGIALGLALSLGVTRLVSSFLYDVTPRDPATLLLSSLTLLVVGLGAALIPARRAAQNGSCRGASRRSSGARPPADSRYNRDGCIRGRN
jgi:putative ABC transport system permease protein